MVKMDIYGKSVKNGFYKNKKRTIKSAFCHQWIINPQMRALIHSQQARPCVVIPSDQNHLE